MSFVIGGRVLRAATWVLVLSGSVGLSGCVSKGATTINNGSGAASKDDEDDEDAGRPESNPSSEQSDAAESPGDPSEATENTDDEGTSASDEAPSGDTTASSNATGTAEGPESDASEQGATVTDTSDDATASGPESDDASGPESDDASEPSTSEPDVSDESTTNSPTATEEPPEPEPVFACSAEMNRVFRAEGVNLTDGDLVDKQEFAVAAGPGEHWLGWIDTAPASPRLLSSSFAGGEASEPSAALFESVPRAGFAATYVAEDDAYAVTWNDDNNVYLNWVVAGAWTDEAQSVAAGVPLKLIGSGLAYGAEHYGVHFLADHAYLTVASATGAGDPVYAGDAFTGSEARDVLFTEATGFITFGRYHDGSVASFWSGLNTFWVGEQAQTQIPVDDLFAEFPINVGERDSLPTGMQLIWDGGAVGLAYGTLASGGAHYARITTGGVVVFDEVVTDSGQATLDLYYDAEQELVYLLSSDGSDVYITGFDPVDATPVIENRLLARGEEVTQGYLLYDADVQRLRAYYSSKDGVHQIFTALVECTEP